MWLRLRGQTVSALKGCQEHILTGFQKKLLKGSFGQKPSLHPPWVRSQTLPKAGFPCQALQFEENPQEPCCQGAHSAASGDP